MKRFKNALELYADGDVTPDQEVVLPKAFTEEQTKIIARATAIYLLDAQHTDTDSETFTPEETIANFGRFDLVDDITKSFTGLGQMIAVVKLAKQIAKEITDKVDQVKLYKEENSTK